MGKRKLSLQRLENRNMMAGDVCEPADPFVPSEPTWHNDEIPTDVNANGETSALDALIIINELDRRDYSDPNNYEVVDAALVDPHPNFYYDVNNNGHITALDALIVINQMARERYTCGEYEVSVDWLMERDEV